MRRAELLAYLIGAGVAGTLIIAPYTGRSILTAIYPALIPLRYVPFFLLPLAWGLWNWLRVRRRLRIGIGAWGAVLGVLLAVAANVFLIVEERWFSAAALLIVALPAGYYLLWTFLVGPLNEALGVELNSPARA
jgi:hypothetical protein